MAAGGGLSRSERKAAERVRRLREEQQRERLRQVGYRRVRGRTRACNRSPPTRPQVSRILRKAAAERSAEEGRLLAESEDLVTELQGRSRRREGLKRRQEEASRGRQAAGGGLQAAGCRRRAAVRMTSPDSRRCVMTRRSCGGRSGNWPELSGMPNTWWSTQAPGSAR